VIEERTVEVEIPPGIHAREPGGRRVRRSARPP
jgi:hypothetical protein